MADQQPSVTTISVKGLFGLYDYTVPLRPERITIIHGPNGAGKTVLLRMTEAVLTGRFDTLRDFTFDEFQLTFDDASWVRFYQSDDVSSDPEARGQRLLALQHQESQGQPAVGPHLLRSRRAPPNFRERITSYFPYLNRVGPNAWVDLRTSEPLRWEDVERLYIQEFGEIPQQPHVNIPSWVRRLQERLARTKARLIRTQRLETLGNAPNARTSVSVYATELAQLMKRQLEGYAATSQELDRSFPTRLFEFDARSVSTVAELQSRLKQIEEKRTRLTQMGFLSADAPLPALDEAKIREKKDVLSIYVSDVEAKLKTFDELAGKIELFRSILEPKFINKRLEINPESGIRFVTSGNRGQPIPPSSLSSGEQHEFVMAFELLFKLSANALVLIDEPEISLHVAWQETFLRDLQKLVEINSINVVVATHSPEIIGNNWPLTVLLSPKL